MKKNFGWRNNIDEKVFQILKRNLWIEKQHKTLVLLRHFHWTKIKF